MMSIKSAKGRSYKMQRGPFGQLMDSLSYVIPNSLSTYSVSTMRMKCGPLITVRVQDP